MSKTPLPCPFCGCSAKYSYEHGDERDGYTNRAIYTCNGCGVSVSASGDTSKGGYADNTKIEAQALAKWNRRTK